MESKCRNQKRHSGRQRKRERMTDRGRGREKERWGTLIERKKAWREKKKAVIKELDRRRKSQKGGIERVKDHWAEKEKW